MRFYMCLVSSANCTLAFRTYELLDYSREKQFSSVVFLLNIVYMSGKSRTFVAVLCGLVKQNGRSNRKI